jgi:hypothetical protein
MDKITLTLNSHALAAFQRCPQSFLFSYIKEIEPITKYKPFVRGTIMTKLLARYYYFKRKGLPLKEIAQDGLDTLKVAKDLTEDEKYDIELRYLAYLNYYRNENWYPEIIENCDIPGHEGSGMSKVLYEDSQYCFIYEGEVDLIVRVGRNSDDLMIVDNKTQSRKSDLYFYTNQFRGYSFLAGISTVCINYIGFQDNPELWFRRAVQGFSQADIKMWQADTLEWFFIVAKAIKGGNYLRSWQCEGKYGLCTYHKLCEIPYEPIREKKIELEFKERDRKRSW